MKTLSAFLALLLACVPALLPAQENAAALTAFKSKTIEIAARDQVAARNPRI